jgi:formylglycine-generating enzyme required for sulfatase activity
LYPWGSDTPDGTPERANTYDTAHSPFIDVGSYPDGVARWGQYDLAGSMWEWMLDWYNSGWYLRGGNTCDNCANLNGANNRVLRSGSWGANANDVRAAHRIGFNPTNSDFSTGFRCARNP